ncbi:MAG: two-component system, NarL family, response regulator DevR [Gaiellaceae bacterium]|jgi:DNA-binding NarL/FixJ family response regulator|nr:two-component system, NarL family, response regulator DevR [Gaiellaceae bacterium]MDX6473227.1 two-component system, NarL family, response regulator DevR [Gaiellaceae bacterium]
MGGGHGSTVLLDPHPIWLDSVQDVLDEMGMSVAEATTVPEEALDAIARLAPRYFVLDPAVRDGESNWLRLIGEAVALDPELTVIAFSESGDAEIVEGAFAAGAAVFIVKTANASDIGAALQLAQTTAIHVARSLPATPDNEALTRREFEILQLVSEGHSNAVIGRRLWLAEQTVKFHLSNVYRKIGVQNRTAAARWAELHGVSSLEATQTGSPQNSAA